eukprot:364988-Chlamydomonas_euryale.AAC.37
MPSYLLVGRAADVAPAPQFFCMHALFPAVIMHLRMRRSYVNGTAGARAAGRASIGGRRGPPQAAANDPTSSNAPFRVPCRDGHGRLPPPMRCWRPPQQRTVRRGNTETDSGIQLTTRAKRPPAVPVDASLPRRLITATVRPPRRRCREDGARNGSPLAIEPRHAMQIRHQLCPPSSHGSVHGFIFLSCLYSCPSFSRYPLTIQPTRYPSPPCSLCSSATTVVSSSDSCNVTLSMPCTYLMAASDSFDRLTINVRAPAWVDACMPGWIQAGRQGCMSVCMQDSIQAGRQAGIRARGMKDCLDCADLTCADGSSTCGLGLRSAFKHRDATAS